MQTPEKRKHPAKPTSKDEPPVKKPLGKKPNTNAAGKGAGGNSINKFKGDGGKRGGFEGKNNKFAGKKPQFNGKGPNSGAPAAAGEKQDWNKFKKEKKDLKLKRKSTRDTYEITQEVKKIYEQVKW